MFALISLLSFSNDRLLLIVISQTALNCFIMFTNRGRRDLISSSSSSSSSLYISVWGSSGHLCVEYVFANVILTPENLDCIDLNLLNKRAR